MCCVNSYSSRGHRTVIVFMIVSTPWRSRCRIPSDIGSSTTGEALHRSIALLKDRIPYRNGRVWCRNGKREDGSVPIMNSWSQRRIGSCLWQALNWHAFWREPRQTLSTMTPKKLMTVAMILAAGTTAMMLRSAPRSRAAATNKPDEVKESSDPFAEMIQEGDGLLAQWKAEAAEIMRKKSRA